MLGRQFLSKDFSTRASDGVAQVVAVANADTPGDAERLARIGIAVGEAARNRARPARQLPTFSARRIVAWSIAGLAAAGMIVLPALLPLTKRAAPVNVPGFAYAQVTEAMQKVRTVSYRTTFIRIIDGKEQIVQCERNWGRLAGEPAQLRHDIATWKGNELRDVLSTPRRQVTYDQTKKAYALQDYRYDWHKPEYRGKNIREGILQQIANPLDVKPERFTMTLQYVDAKGRLTTKKTITLAEYGTTRTLWAKSVEDDKAGKPLVVFRRTEADDRKKAGEVKSAWYRTKRFLWKPSDGLPRFIIVQTKVWVNPDTRRMVREEMTAQNGKVRIVLDDFRYDFDPPKGIFDWSEGDDNPAARVAP